MHVLRRLKCFCVGHVRDTWTPMAFSQPGSSRCARCGRFSRVKGQLGLEHAAVLRKIGWTDDEINTVAFTTVPASEVLRFLDEVRRATSREGASVIEHYEQGYIMGYYAALRDTK